MSALNHTWLHVGRICASASLFIGLAWASSLNWSCYYIRQSPEPARHLSPELYPVMALFLTGGCILVERGVSIRRAALRDLEVRADRRPPTWFPHFDFRHRRQRIIVPLWIPCVALLVVLQIARRKARLPFRPDCCPACGYSKTGNTSGICPECGTKHSE